MRTILWSKRCSAAVVGAWLVSTSAGCASKAPDLRTAETLPKPKPPERDGEPTYAPRAKGETGSRPVVLEEPLGETEALAATRAFLRAVTTRDERKVLADIAPNAVWLQRGDRPAGLLAPLWAERLRRLSYDKLAEVAFVDRVEVMDDGGGRAPTDREEGRPQGMRPGDLYVRVKLAVARVGAERLFADELGLVLRKEGARVRIIASVEDFSLP